VRGLVELAAESFPEPEEDEWHSDAVRVAIVGRPNVGKSTLINTLLGEERVIAFDAPGTTRDSIEIDFERGGASMCSSIRRACASRESFRGDREIFGGEPCNPSRTPTW
jgi:predicted GTPase